MSDRLHKHRKHNRRHRESLWFKLYHSFTAIGRCHWCQRKLRFVESVFDHDPPLSLGGVGSKGVISCAKCDADRATELSRMMNKIKALAGSEKQENKRIERAWGPA